MSKKGRILAVASQKGGVGKTTTAVNVAACLSVVGKTVLLVDLDPQGNATSGVGIARAEKCFLRTCLIENHPVSTAVRESSFPGLSVLPSAPELSDLSLHNEIKPRRMKAFQRLVGRLSCTYDFMIIDCPPSTGLLPELALSVSQSVIVPVQCEYYAMEGLSQILPEIERVQKDSNPKLKIAGLLLTMFDPELELSQEVAREVGSYFRDYVYRTTVPRDVTLAEAASHGQPILSYDIASRGAWSYICLTKEVIENGYPQVGSRP
jgi:chromosome partitioning protein